MTDLTSSLRIALIDDVSSPAGKMAAAIKAAEVQAKELDHVMTAAGSAGVSDKLLGRLKAMGASADHVKAAASAFRDLAKAEGLAEDRSKWTVKQAQAIRNLESVTTAQVRSQIGMERALATEQARNSVRRMHELSEERRHFQSHLKGMASDLAASAGFMGGAYTGIKIGEHAVRAGAVLATEEQRFRDAGKTATAALPEALRVSRDVANRVPGTTPAENLRVISETKIAFGSVEEAIKNLERLQTISQAVKIATGGKVDVPADELGQSFAKILEMRGSAMNPVEFKRESDAMVRAIVGTSGRLTPQRYLAYAQAAGRGTASNLSTRYLTEVAPTLIGDTNSPETVGTAQKGLRQIFMGHLSSKTQGQEWAKLIPGFDKTKLHLKGTTPGWEVGAIPDTQLALTDPDKWIDKYILGIDSDGKRLQDSAAVRAHVDINDKLQVSQLLGRLAPKIGGGNNMLEALGQAASRRQLAADAPQYREAHDAEQIVRDHAKADAQQGVKNLNSSIESLFSTLTSGMMPKAGEALDYLRDRIADLNKAAEGSPAVRGAVLAGGAATVLGGGYAGMKAIDIFGLGTSATALTGSAAALTEAAAALGASAAGGGVAGTVGKVAAGAAGLGAGGAAIAATAGAAVMAGTVYGLQKWHPTHSYGRGTVAPKLPSTEDRATRATSGDAVDSFFYNSGPGAPAAKAPWHRGASLDTGILPAAFTKALSSSPFEQSLARGTAQGFLQAFQTVRGGASGDVGGIGGGGAGGGLINASFETGDIGGRSGGGLSAGSSGGRTGLTPGPGSLGRGDPVSIAEHMLGANGRQAASMLHSKMTPGEWCADFVNGVIKGAGGQGVNSSMARAFNTWGKAVANNDAKRGDVILERHGDHTGHVGLATGRVQRDASGRVTAVEMVSGNYGHAVRRNWERVGKIGGLRRGRQPGVPDTHPIGHAITALNDADVTPMVDTKHLERTAALLDHIHDRIHTINGGVGARGAGSYRTAMNGSFAVDNWRRSA